MFPTLTLMGSVCEHFTGHSLVSLRWLGGWTTYNVFNFYSVRGIYRRPVCRLDTQFKNSGLHRHITAAFSCRELLLIRLVEQGDDTCTFHTCTPPLTCHRRSTLLVYAVALKSIPRPTRGRRNSALCHATQLALRRVFGILISLSHSSSLHSLFVHVRQYRRCYFRSRKLNRKEKKK